MRERSLDRHHAEDRCFKSTANDVNENNNKFKSRSSSRGDARDGMNSEQDRRMYNDSKDMDIKSAWNVDSTAGSHHMAVSQTMLTRRSLSSEKASPVIRCQDATTHQQKQTSTPLYTEHTSQPCSPWRCSRSTILTTLISFLIISTITHSFLSTHIDTKRCRMSYMRPSFVKFNDFDTEYTRLATKYSLYLYREGGIDEDPKVKGIPVLFIPGNAGSHKQVRPIAAEAAVYFHDVLRNDEAAMVAGKRSLDFFSVDFNEDITAFHGQTLLDQADYLNDAISFILALYNDPQRSSRDSELPDPSSVLIVGHSMGGIVARTMLTRTNYLSNSINTIVTLSAPHARPPVSFDSDIVRIYDNINSYWRTSYAQKEAHKNPLEQLTLISIAGGALDTVVPSDYASLSSLVPESHGFTVFTSTIPQVWTGMDHLAIMWCDQLRKVIVKALYNVVDATQSTQTHSRADRIAEFRKHFLTGLEPLVQKDLPSQELKALQTVDGGSSTYSIQKEEIVLRLTGQLGKPDTRFLHIPRDTMSGDRLTIMSDQPLDGSSHLQVLACSSQIHHQHTNNHNDVNPHLGTKINDGVNRLMCRDLKIDLITLPQASPTSESAFDEVPPLYYLEYRMDDLVDYDYIAVIDNPGEARPGWLVAKFTSRSNSISVTDQTFPSLILNGVQHIIPSSANAMVSTLHIPIIHSSMLAYRISVQTSCSAVDRLFRPLLRQYISYPYESKFFPNLDEKVSINLHGVSPFIIPPSTSDGLSLQFWIDPTCDGPIRINLKVDLYASIGKLYMRYRTVFAAFPLLVVCLVLRKQFIVYNATGVFITFAQSMDQCIRTSLPLIFTALTFLTVSLGHLSETSDKKGTATETLKSYTINEILLGSYDPYFWFLVPLFGILSVGICIATNYLLLSLVYILSVFRTLVLRLFGSRSDDISKIGMSSNSYSPTRRFITTVVLILLIATVIPYQFAYLVLVIVQILTSVRAHGQSINTSSTSTSSFQAYTLSLLNLLIWILPINIPVLVVWIHNLSVPYLVPFSSHHNIAAILPYMLLVETVSAGHMIPRIQCITSATFPRLVRNVTSISLFVVAIWAAVYGVSWAYTLHMAVDCVCGWLFVVHCFGNTRWFGGHIKSLHNVDTVKNLEKDNRVNNRVE